MNNEVTADELKRRGIEVSLGGKEERQWVKFITLSYEGKEYELELAWDDIYGYNLSTEEGEDLPEEIVKLTERPEFEYILDSLTEEVGK